VLEVAEQICHRVGILAHGNLRAQGTAMELRSEFGGESLEDTFLQLTDDAAGRPHDAATEHGDGAAAS